MAIVLKGVTKRYNGTVALDNVSATIPEGEITVVLGPSGSGKTTLLRIIAGLETPDKGRITIGEEDITHKPPWARGIAMVFQTPSLFPHLTVRENIGFGLEAHGVYGEEAEERIRWAAELLHIDHLLDRTPDQLSGGEQQRVALARALVVKPRILLLDEPLSNLDLALREELRIELRGIQRETGITFIHVTHDQDEALELADHLIVLYRGRIVEQGDPMETYRYPHSIEAAKVFGHNIIRCKLLDRGVAYPWQEIYSREGGREALAIVPQFMISIVEGGGCFIRDIRARRNYGIVVVECRGAVLRVAVSLGELSSYSIGEKVSVVIEGKVSIVPTEGT